MYTILLNYNCYFSWNLFRLFHFCSRIYVPCIWSNLCSFFNWHAHIFFTDLRQPPHYLGSKSCLAKVLSVEMKSSAQNKPRLTSPNTLRVLTPAEVGLISPISDRDTVSNVSDRSKVYICTYCNSQFKKHVELKKHKTTCDAKKKWYMSTGWGKKI